MAWGRMAVHAMGRRADEPTDTDKAICKIFGEEQYTAQEISFAPAHFRHPLVVEWDEHQECCVKTRTLAVVNDEQICSRLAGCRRESRQYL